MLARALTYMDQTGSSEQAWHMSWVWSRDLQPASSDGALGEAAMTCAYNCITDNDSDSEPQPRDPCPPQLYRDPPYRHPIHLTTLVVLTCNLFGPPPLSYPNRHKPE